MNFLNIISRSDKLILLLLAVQVCFVSLSIAVSSIAFGVWVGLWLIQIIATRKIDLDKKLFSEIRSINIFILLYILFETLSRFFAVYPEGAFNNLKRVLLFLIFFVSIIKIIDLKTLYRILFLNVCILSVISCFELIQYFLQLKELLMKMNFSEIRIDYLNYPLTTAEIKMMSLLALMPLLFIKEKFFIPKIYLVLIMTPVFVSMMLTQSRNVMLAMIVCIFILGIVQSRKFLIASFALIIIGILFLPSGMTDRIKSIADVNHPSNQSRIEMYKTGLEIFKDHPLTGVADSHILEIYSTYKKPDVPGEGVHLHNNFIMILATTGIFGFISFFIMFILIFLKQIKLFRKESPGVNKMLILGSILVMISFQICGLFEWTFGDHEVMTVFYFLLSVPFVILKLDTNTD
ncbi:MAG: O-antigen ligase family protein [Ignavibacteria bacterium]|nr:O-antigen ligase family protein [Ignavibacteria bacterium]